MALNEQEAHDQIEQMVRFIKQEAQEKASEISVSAEEEFNIEKLHLLEAEKGRLRKEFERREGQIDVKKKIDYSKQLNASRIKVLQAREDAVQSVIEEAHSKLAGFSSDGKKYETLLTDLLVQSLHRLQQPSTVVKAREVDLPIVKKIVEPARKAFAAKFKTEAPEVRVDEDSFLPPPPGQKSEEHESCAGGISVSNAEGTIVCANTLDARLQIAYQANLPQIRASLFGSAAH